MRTGWATNPRLAALALGFMFLAPAHAVHASPVAYSFASTASPVSFCKNPTSGLFDTGSCDTPLYGTSASVSGSFLYDAGVALTNLTGDGRSRYVGSLSNLSGSIGADAFQALSGATIVGNEFVGGTNDLLTLIATGTDLVGFTIGSRKLISVIFAWQEGDDGFGFIGPDFLSDQTLPTSLPAFEGRVQLSFADLSAPTVVTAFVVFPGLSVRTQSVPEPASLALLTIAGVAAARRRAWRS